MTYSTEQLLRYLHERDQMRPAERFAVALGLALSASRRSEYRQMARLHHDLGDYFAPSSFPTAPTATWQITAIPALLAVALMMGGIWFAANRRMSNPAHLRDSVSASHSQCSFCHRSTAECPHCKGNSHPPTAHICR